MASVAVESQPSVVTRVANLPLVSSTYDLVSSAYISTKDQYPYLKSLCEMAEKGVKTITSVAMSGALPIIQKLEPQIAIANTYACKGLDRIEEKLPILNQPTNQVVANAKGAVTGAKDAMTTTVTGAKDCVASTITEVVDKTKEAVTGSVEKTKSVVNGSINTVLGSRMMQLVSSGVEKAFTKSELLVDQYLPLTEEELEKEAKKWKDLIWFRSQVIMLDWDPCPPSSAHGPTSRPSPGLKKSSKKPGDHFSAPFHCQPD